MDNEQIGRLRNFLEEEEVRASMSVQRFTSVRFYLKGKESSELRQSIYTDPSKFGITNHNFMKTYVQKRNIILMAYLECRKDQNPTRPSEGGTRVEPFESQLIYIRQSLCCGEYTSVTPPKCTYDHTGAS